MPRKHQYVGGIIGASPVPPPPTPWTPANLTNTPYLWMDANQGFTNQGDGGAITVNAGWTGTSTQNGLGTVSNTNTSGNFYWPSSSNINTTFALVKGDATYASNTNFKTMFSGSNTTPQLGGNTTSYGVIGSAYTTVETWRHTRDNGTQINYSGGTNAGDWGTRSTDWKLYSFQSSINTPWTISLFGRDRIYGGRHFSGEVAEILALEEELSLADIEKVEGYLAHRWGLASILPSSHTYKSEFPAI